MGKRRPDAANAMATKPETLPPRDLASIGTLSELFAWRVVRTPLAEAYRQYDDALAQWVGVSWRDASQRVAAVRVALAGLALPHGARVAILLPNGVQAVCVDQAVLALACVPVPMHALDNSTSIAYILSDSDASLLVASSAAQWHAIVDTGVSLPALRMVVVMERALAGSEPLGSVPVLSMEQWLSNVHPVMADQELRQAVAGDLAALVYTSGTTGKPKGVMLTHGNVVSNVLAVMQRVAPREEEVFLSFLPLSHTLERTAGYYLPVAAGACVAFARSTKLLLQDLQSVRPTILISVPRIYERAFASIQAGLAKSSIKSWLFDWAQTVGWRRFCRRQGRLHGPALQTALDAIAWPVLNRLVAQTLQNQFGGRLRLAVSGGAALSHPVARCFLGLGVPIVQGYGMTETAPVVSVNTLVDNDPASVGRALAGVQVRIGENRELLVRGPNVMRGYWKRDEDTARSFVEGWLRTGDQAAIEAGRIRILGRIKEIIVTSTGEKIAPADLELAITADAAFEAAYAFGDDRPFIACALVLSSTYWERLAADLRVDPKDPASLQSTAARAAVLQRVLDLTRGFPRYAQPRAVLPTLAPWTIENALVTPTLKLKRNNLAVHFAAEIERIYQH
jgi:long-chain acyl-CoA synthetase